VYTFMCSPAIWSVTHLSNILTYHQWEIKNGVTNFHVTQPVGKAFRSRRDQIRADLSKQYSEKLNDWTYHQILADQILNQLGRQGLD